MSKKLGEEDFGLIVPAETSVEDVYRMVTERILQQIFPEPPVDAAGYVFYGFMPVRYVTLEELQQMYPTKHSKPVDSHPAPCNKGSSARC